MLTGIDHLVIAVADPDAAVGRAAATLGLAPGGGGRHPELGTFNRLVWLGDAYLEFIGVEDRDLAERSWVGAPAVRALAAGGGLATWAIASDDIEADVGALRARGSDLAPPQDGLRTRPDGAVVRWRLGAAPTLGPTAAPFLIEHDLAAAEWTPRDRAARAAGPARLTTLELAVDDVSGTSQRLLRTVGLRFRPSLAGGGARDASVGPHILRLRPRRDPTAPSVTIRLAISGRVADQVDLLGCRWIVEPR